MSYHGARLAVLSGIGAAFAVLISAGLNGSVQAAPFIIDDFSLPADGTHITRACPAGFTTGLCSGISSTSAVTNYTDGGSTGAIWGDIRNVRLHSVAGTTNTPTDVVVSSSASGSLGFSNADGNTSTMVLEYNGTAGFQGTGASANAAVNFLAFGNVFNTRILSLDLSIASRIRLWDSDGTEARHDFTKPGSSSGETFPFEHYVHLGFGAGEFTNQGGGDGLFDFTDVVAVNVAAFGIPQGTNVGQGVDLTLDLIQITNISEPVTMALFGVGLIGVGVARRRRQVAP